MYIYIYVYMYTCIHGVRALTPCFCQVFVGFWHGIPPRGPTPRHAEAVFGKHLGHKPLGRPHVLLEKNGTSPLYTNSYSLVIVI